MSTILVIDDQATNRQVLSRLASQADEEAVVHAFADPREALEWVVENTPDLVVTDYKMPGMDGAEFTRQFRAQPLCFDVPVIVVTIYEERSFRYRALEAGATDFLISPVDHQEFQVRIRNLLHLRSQQTVIRKRTRTLEKRLVSDSQQHEAQLRETRDILRQVIDAVPALVSAADVDGKIVFANSAFAEHGEATTGDIVGRNRSELLSDRDADRHAALDKRLLDRVEEQLAFEEEIADPDGETRTFLTVKSPLRTADDQVSSVVTASLDISDRKQMEQIAQRQQNHLRVIVDNIPNWVYATDEEQRFTLVNLAMGRALGTGPDEMIGKVFSDYLDDDVAILREQFADKEVLRSGQETKVDEFSYLDASGERQWMQTTKVPFVSSTGDIEVLSVAINISERRRAEEVLRNAMEEAEEANRHKTEFLANLSHELRTPLNHVMGFAQLMADEVFGEIGNPRYRDYARVICDSGTHLTEILEDILDISKLETGNLTLAESDFDLNQVIGSVVTMVAGRVEQAELKLSTKLGVENAMVHGDERMVRQMLLNLVSNATKFTPEGGTICITTTSGDDGSLQIAVSDTGIGIAENDFDKVLSPFGQADDYLHRSHEGTGLGLSLVKSMIELHGGWLELTSEVGSGTTVTLLLPASCRAGEQPEAVDLSA
ncbi:MAG: PAS domain-containing protein [Alphaproteobacteria bacterium]|nr:PAS domain-containing protein [Alphaproteobacteria bacterium]